MPEIGRRQFLGAAAAGVGGTLLGAQAAAATQGFALVSDTHLNPAAPDRTVWMRDVFAAIADRDPAYVLHCGDITDSGTREEIELYVSTIPDALAGKVIHTPGNHELRWDRAGGETYVHYFGQGPKSFDRNGMHIVALDPAMVLQEPAHFGTELLDWLDDDLRGVSAPVFLFQHHPVGDTWFYTDDQDHFLATVSDARIRGIFAGHIHAEFVRRMNGFVEVTCNALKNGPGYYWAQPTGEQLVITRVDLDDATTTDVTSLPIAGAGPAAELKPSRLTIDASTSTLAIRATFDSTPTTVDAQVLPETGFGQTIDQPFTSLTKSGDHWTGNLAASALSHGTHQIRVRAASAGAWWDVVRDVRLAGDGRRWQRDLTGAIQGGLAVAGSLVIAATTGGRVAAYDASGRRVWVASTGPVYREPAAGAGTVVVPGADHTVTALHAGTGRRRWQIHTDEPVLSTPLIADDAICCAAGGALLCLDAATGTRRWATPVGGFSAGRPATDGDRVFVGAGDAKAHAFDAATGKPLWTFTTRDTTDPYVALLYGPWDDRAIVIPDGPVVVSSVSSTWALDRSTGQAIWSVSGSAMYAGPRLVMLDGTPHVLLIQERIKTFLVNALTGIERWRLQLGFPVFNSGAVVDGEAAWIVGANSQLARVDLRTGAVERVVKLGSAYSFSTPILLGDNVIVADQSGTIRAVSR